MNFDQFFAGISFRTNRPQFESGDEHKGFVTGVDTDTSIIRVGDTVLRLDGESAPVDAYVAFRVTAFDKADSTGQAELLNVITRPD